MINLNSQIPENDLLNSEEVETQKNIELILRFGFCKSNTVYIKI